MKQATWIVPGVISNLRVLRSDKNKNWHGYIIQVAGLGSTYELQAEQKMFESVGVGESIVASGIFEHFNGRLRLICTAIRADESAAKAPAAAK